MQTIIRSVPKCPGCGSTEVELVGSRPHFGFGDGKTPASFTVAYKCGCGLGFTETIKGEPASPPDFGAGD